MAGTETESIPGMALHVSNLSTGEVGREDWEFKVSVGHVVSFPSQKNDKQINKTEENNKLTMTSPNCQHLMFPRAQIYISIYTQNWIIYAKSLS